MSNNEKTAGLAYSFPTVPGVEVFVNNHGSVTIANDISQFPDSFVEIGSKERMNQLIDALRDLAEKHDWEQAVF